VDGGFSIPVPEEVLDAVAERVAEILAEDHETRAATRWLTIEEAAERLRLTASAVRKRAERGQLPGSVKDGARWLVDGAALDEALATKLDGDRKNRGERRG
jgi:excisionase family DNA binding protein